MPKMTEAELRIWIAERNGYEKHAEYNLWEKEVCLTPRHFRLDDLPDYLHDLNAAWGLIEEACRARAAAGPVNAATWLTRCGQALHRADMMNLDTASMAATICRMYYQAVTGETVEVEP